MHDRRGEDADGGACRCGAAASRSSVPTSRTGGWGHGPRCWPRWPVRARPCTGCSGWPPRSPTTGAASHAYLATEAVADAGVGRLGVVRGVVGRHGLARVRPRRGAGGPGAPHEVGRGRVRGARPRGGVSRPVAGAMPTCRWSRCSAPRTWLTSCCAPMRPAHPSAAVASARRPVADGDGGELVERAGRRHGARHVLGGRVAAHRGAKRLPGPAPPGLGPLDPGGGDGTARLGCRGAQGRGVSHGGPGRLRAAAPGRLRLDGAPRPRVRGARPA